MITEKLLWDAVWLAAGFGLPFAAWITITIAAITTPLPDRARRGRKGKA